MLSEIFYWVLNISIIGGVTGLIVALLRKIPKLPRFAVYLLWSLPLVRLWVPFGIANKWSLLNLISKYSTKTVVIWERVPGTPDFSMTNSIQAARSYFPIVFKTDLLKNIFEVASAKEKSSKASSKTSRTARSPSPSLTKSCGLP